jgi:hypothetical protein
MLRSSRHGPSRHAWLLAVASALFALGCSSAAPLPGTALGTYNVTGTQQTNTCGTGLGAPNPWTFTAQMSEDATTFYWLMNDGTEMSGTMTSSTAVTLQSTLTANVDGNEAGPGSCDLTSVSGLSLTLATTSPPSTFTGTLSYQFSAATGVSDTNDCTDQLSASGGMYDTLPCAVSYSLTATRQ